MKSLTFLITLISMVIYAFVGGAVFMILESKNEKEFKSEANSTIATLMEKNTCLPEQDLLTLQSLFVEMKKAGVLMKKDGTTFYRDKFDVRSSIMITTFYYCGFGVNYLNPVTVGGKLFSIFYLLFASYYFFFVSYASSEIFNVVLMAIFPKLSDNGRKKWRFLAVRQSIMILIALVIFFLVPAAVIQNIEEWSFSESLYFCFVYLITLGFSDYQPGETVIPRSEDFIQWYRMFLSLWILIASLWINIIMVHYSWFLGAFLWETTSMAVQDNIENINRKIEKKSKKKALKDFIKKRKAAWARKQISEKHNDPSRFQPPRDPTFPRDTEYIEAITTDRLESSYKADNPITVTGLNNVIPIKNNTFTHLDTNSSISYPRFSNSNASIKSLISN